MILHIDHPMTGHDLQITRWSQYRKRAMRAGHAYAEVSGRYRSSNDSTWASARKANLIRGSIWPVSLAVVILAGVRFGFLPFAIWLALLLLLSSRAAWKARWKGGNPWTLFLYGIHSHLQQVPILLGQLDYEVNRRQGRTRKLIEYKESRVD